MFTLIFDKKMQLGIFTQDAFKFLSKFLLCNRPMRINRTSSLIKVTLRDRNSVILSPTPHLATEAAIQGKNFILLARSKSVFLELISVKKGLVIQRCK